MNRELEIVEKSYSAWILLAEIDRWLPPRILL